MNVFWSLNKTYQIPSFPLLMHSSEEVFFSSPDNKHYLVAKAWIFIFKLVCFFSPSN